MASLVEIAHPRPSFAQKREVVYKGTGLAGRYRLVLRHSPGLAGFEAFQQS